MTIADTFKKHMPKTKKGWALTVIGGTAVVLLGNYVYVDNKESAWAMQLWRKISPLPPPGHPAARHGRHPHHRQAQHRPPPQMQMPQMPSLQPMPQVMPPSAVFVEPMFEPFPSYMPGYPHNHFPFGGFTHHARPFYGHHQFYGHHHVGAPPVDAPQAPEKTRTVVPPPGAYGIVGRSPGEVTGVEGSHDAAPCGPGLWFDPATHSCVPFPTTPPFAPTQTGYDWA